LKDDQALQQSKDAIGSNMLIQNLLQASTDRDGDHIKWVRAINNNHDSLNQKNIILNQSQQIHLSDILAGMSIHTTYARTHKQTKALLEFISHSLSEKEHFDQIHKLELKTTQHQIDEHLKYLELHRKHINVDFELFLSLPAGHHIPHDAPECPQNMDLNRLGEINTDIPENVQLLISNHNLNELN
jgi:hypothetical protein